MQKKEISQKNEIEINFVWTAFWKMAKGGVNTFAPPIRRLGIRSYSWGTECLRGDVEAGPATAFPQALGLAATFRYLPEQFDWQRKIQNFVLRNSFPLRVFFSFWCDWYHCKKKGRGRRLVGLFFLSPFSPALKGSFKWLQLLVWKWEQNTTTTRHMGSTTITMVGSAVGVLWSISPETRDGGAIRSVPN